MSGYRRLDPLTFKRPRLPTEIDLGTVAPGDHKQAEAGAYAAADGDVKVVIEGDSNGPFRIARIAVYDLEPDPDAPPGSPPVLVLAGSIDGPGPISVQEGEAVLVSVLFTAPLFSPHDSFSATAVMQATTWAKPVRIPVKVTLGGVEVEAIDPRVSIVRRGRAFARVRVKSLGGAGTDVGFSMFAKPHGVILDPGTQTVSVAGGATAEVELGFLADVDAPLGVFASDGLQFGAFNGEQQGALDQLLAFDVAGVDTSVVWEEPTDRAILRDQQLNAWHAGKVNDIVVRSDATFVATDTGGIWAIDRGQPGAPAGCTTDDLDTTNFTCLAFGPDSPLQIFAGTYDPGGLCAGGFGAFARVNIVDGAGSPIDTGVVYRIAVLKQRRVIVLAADQGVFWCRFPVSSNPFNAVDSLPQRPYTGIAVGPDDSVVVSAWGDGTTGGFFHGTWTDGRLLFEPATLTGDLDARQMARTSLAACASDPSVMYAVAGAFAPAGKQGDYIYRIARSGSGGKTWEPVPNAGVRVVQNMRGRLAPDVDAVCLPGSHPPGCMAGVSGFHTNCIAVDARNQSLVAVGWANGPWISTDAGSASPGTSTWTLRYEQDGSGANVHMHGDLNNIVFDSGDATGDTIYVCTDGGLLLTTDQAGDQGYQSFLNAHLRNLQFYSRANRFSQGFVQVGGISASPVHGGLVAGPTQDNGNLYSAFDAAGSAPWDQLEGGDGVMMRFLSNGLLVDVSPSDTKARLSRWDGAAFQDRALIPVRRPGADALVVMGDVASVEAPHFRDQDTQQLMYAAAATESLPGVRRNLFGLFIGDGIETAFWDLIATLPIDPKDMILSVASLRGDQVFAGTKSGRIFSLAPNQDPFELHVTPSDPGSVHSIVVVRDALAFAVYEGQATNAILQSDFFSWDPLGANDNVARGIGLQTEGEPFRALAIDRGASPPTLFAATDSRVFVSRDLADTWLLANRGLPKRPHCTSFATGALRANGGRYIYLGTYGRSVWQARLA